MDLNGYVTPIDVATNTVGPRINLGYDANGMAISPNGHLLYVSSAGGDVVIPVNLQTNQVETPITVPNGPAAITFSPDGDTVYVANSSGLTPIVVGTGSVETPIALGGQPADAAMAITPDGTEGYVAVQGGLNEVVPVNLLTNEAGTPIPVADAPDQVAMTPDGSAVFATGIERYDSPGVVTPIDTFDNEPMPPISLPGEGSDGIAIGLRSSTRQSTESREHLFWIQRSGGRRGRVLLRPPGHHPGLLRLHGRDQAQRPGGRDRLGPPR